jgi:gas vesicle protein
LDKREEEISKRNNEKKEDISDEHKASLGDAFKTAAISGAIAGVLELSIGLYKKHKAGKSIFKGELTADDWKELGVDTCKSALGGFIAGGSIYLLTNFLNTPAPLASAFVSVGKGLSSLYSSYDEGEISSEELGELSLILASESAIVYIFSTIGQTAIPIPILGALIGSVAGRIIAETATGKVKKEAEKLLQQTDDLLNTISEVNQKIYDEINNKFNALSSMTDAAFDTNNNKFLIDYSIQLARSYGVEEKHIIKNKADLDKFFIN